jgi:hypothetical protein
MAKSHKPKHTNRLNKSNTLKRAKQIEKNREILNRIKESNA